MKRIIDLRNDLCGHVTLWSKGWYGNEDAITRLGEIVCEWSGLSAKQPPDPKNALEICLETAIKVDGNINHLTNDLLRHASFRNIEYVTSYNIGWADPITPADLLYALRGIISIVKVKDDDIEILLPELLPGLVKKYQLKTKNSTANENEKEIKNGN